jgi:hypothetical protein
VLDDYLDSNPSDGVKPSANATITILVNGVSGNVSSATKGNTITVRVAIPSSAISWVTPRFITANTSIVQSITMIRQISSSQDSNLGRGCKRVGERT